MCVGRRGWDRVWVCVTGRFIGVFFIFLTVAFSSFFTVPVSDNCLFQQRGKCDIVLVFYFSGSGASAEVGRGE